MVVGWQQQVDQLFDRRKGREKRYGDLRCWKETGVGVREEGNEKRREEDKTLLLYDYLLEEEFLV